jgi:DNA (cytosine-5)-methyltransferase 1
MITHYDLFAGIGGFSLALDEVFHDETIKHIFCEWESFPTAVLKQHWPDGTYYGDIADLVADTERNGFKRHLAQEAEGQDRFSDRKRSHEDKDMAIVTGGFPCQPFSHAGRRRGTSDDRYKWPEMFAVIRNVKPAWVVAENVRGLVTWNDGMVLEQVCSDLESEGYEVQPLIIPAVAVNAPHRRDRVWIIACNTEHDGQHGAEDAESNFEREYRNASGAHEVREPQGADRLRAPATDAGSRQSGGLQHQPRQAGAEDRTSREVAADSRRIQRFKGRSASVRSERKEPKQQDYRFPDWNRNWQEVAFATCDDAVDDGLPRLVDGVSYSRAKWRKHSLKAYGNGIVNQVAMEIMKAIKGASL